MIERKGLGELTAIARLGIRLADANGRGETDAQLIENVIDRLALVSGFTVDEVYAPIFAERFGYQWREPTAA